jgi:hypothetical protein
MSVVNFGNGSGEPPAVCTAKACGSGWSDRRSTATRTSPSSAANPSWTRTTNGARRSSNPRLVAEVLSPSTELYDRTKKFQQLMTRESFQEYVLAPQFEPRVETLYRHPDGQWRMRFAVGLDPFASNPSASTCRSPRCTPA